MSYVGIGNRQDYIADFPTQEFSGNSTTTTFTLNFEAVTGAVRVAVDNVLQPADGSSYYVNGNSLTFTSAPASGTNNISVVYLGTVRNISSVSDNAITAAKLNSAAITGQTAETSVADDDLVLIYDDSATALRKMTKSNFTSGLATTNGITEADQWKLTTNAGVGAGSYLLSANWSRQTGRGSGYFGTGMTESSGVFSFPSTGYWLVQFQQTWEAAAGVTTNQISSYIKYSDDNFSTSNTATESFGNITQSGDYESITISYLLDVTDISNQKLKFGGYVSAGTNYVYGGGSVFYTGVTFMRLGDT